MNKPHKHWKEIAQYAQDAAETDKPWERWEIRDNDFTPWTKAQASPRWNEDMQYRRKPRFILINGIEVPEPMREKPEVGSHYWVPEVSSPAKYASIIVWCNDDDDKRWLELGICHLTREAAELHAMALLSFTKKEEAK